MSLIHIQKHVMFFLIKYIEIFSVYRNGDDKSPSHKILLDRRILLNIDKVG